MDWQHFIFDPEQDLLSSMQRIAKKRFFDTEMARTAVDKTIDALSENEWAKLNKYEGRNSASARTYFFVVFRRCLEDQYRSHFGRCEPPKWVKLLGQFWVTLYKQLCCQSVDQTALLLEYHEDFDEAEVKGAISTIKQKDPKCESRGKRVQMQSLDQAKNSEQHSALTPKTSINQVQESLQTNYEDAVHALHLWLKGSACEEANSQALLSQLGALNIDKASLGLLRLVYQEGMKLPEAAKLARIPEHTARRRVNDAKRKIADCFAALGISF